MSEVTLIKGDATDTWPLPDNSLDSIVTDPPYGIAFMGKEWDDKGGPQAYQEWTAKWASEAFRCLKPGGFLLAFGSTRMVHRMACGFEDAGFRILDTIEWLYLNGFPKAQDIGKMFDKRAGAERENKRIPYTGNALLRMGGQNTRPWMEAALERGYHELPGDNPVSDLAKQWDGWKTPALKPAHEPIVMAQKPFSGTFCENIERWGVGAINVDGCRIGDEVIMAHSGGEVIGTTLRLFGAERKAQNTYHVGRFPANVVTLDEDAWYSPYFNVTPRELSKKASPSEKKGDGWVNRHPTVKPVDLMRWLQRLVTPPGGITASPFLGSGTDAVAAIMEGFNFWGMEIAEEYWPIIEARVAEAKRKVDEQEQSRPVVEQVRLF